MRRVSLLAKYPGFSFFSFLNQKLYLFIISSLKRPSEDLEKGKVEVPEVDREGYI